MWQPKLREQKKQLDLLKNEEPSEKGHFIQELSLLFKTVQCSQCPDTLPKSMGNDTQDLQSVMLWTQVEAMSAATSKHYNLSLNVGNELLTHTKRRLVLS